MPVINRIAEFHNELSIWRRDLHAHPETAFEEFRTSDFVAEKLAEFGLCVPKIRFCNIDGEGRRESDVT